MQGKGNFQVKKLFGKIGQAIAEYFLVLCVMLSAVIATGFVGKARNALQVYFGKAVNTISVDK